MKTTVFTNPHGVPMTARLVETGDRFGRNDCLTHDKPEPMIEFFDARRNQFVSCYYASILRESRDGILLDTGSPDWIVSAENVAYCLQTLLGDNPQ